MEKMYLIRQWQEGLLDRPLYGFPKAVVVTGERDAHLGPRWDFARVRVRFEPAEAFGASQDCVAADRESREFAQAALFGVLDVLMTYFKNPVLNVCVTIEHVEIHEIDSNVAAFRLAGRDAAMKALESVGLRQSVTTL